MGAMPSPEWFDTLRTPSAERPLRVLLSGCLSGSARIWDGTPYPAWDPFARLAALSTVRLVSFCPEHFAFGTPRELCDIHGGDGDDVLDGRAKVLSETGKDWTDGMLRAAHRMLHEAREHGIELAILMDMSAACGSQVISLGSRTVASRAYQRGRGVCAALLERNGIPVMAQRDFGSIERLLSKLDPAHVINPRAVDHHQTPWYREYFGVR